MSERKLLLVVDETPEFQAALRYACRRAQATDARIVLLRVLEKSTFDQWAGVRDEIERQERAEAEAALQAAAEAVVAETGRPPEFAIREGETRDAVRAEIAGDADIRLLILAAAGGKNPGPLVATIAKEGVAWGSRKIPVTVVPGDLTDAEIDELA